MKRQSKVFLPVHLLVVSPTSFFRIGIELVLALVMCIASDAYPQQQKTAAISTDDLLRRIGIVRVSTAAPDFALRDTAGNTVSLSSQRGSLVFLNFWATWCKPCRDEMPSMQQLHRQLNGQGLNILAINVKENRQQVASFMRNYGLTFPALLDLDGKVSSSYRVWAYPTTHLINASGQIIGTKSGPKDWASRQVIDTFRSLLGDRRTSPGMVEVLDPGPVGALPTSLRTKSKDTAVHIQQDARSEIIVRLDAGEEVTLLGEASGAGEVWYMIKTKTGVVGWIKNIDAAEKSKTK